MDYEKAWNELRSWIEDQDHYNDHAIREVADKMDDIEFRPGKSAEAEAIREVLDVVNRFTGGLTQSEEDAVKLLKEKYW